MVNGEGRYVMDARDNKNTFMRQLNGSRGLLFGVLIVAALMAFEIFNFSTTEFALHDLLGDLSFAAVRWSTILAVAFCGIDFAGIARLFTPEQGSEEPAEVWYLFGAWLLAAAMNAMLTWWGVSIAILNNESLGNAVIGQETLLRVAPIFVAVLVWLIRVLIIGTFSVAGERLFSQAETWRGRTHFAGGRFPAPAQARNVPVSSGARNYARPAPSFHPAPKPSAASEAVIEPTYNGIPEPTYHPVAMKAGDEGARQAPHQNGVRRF
jgi:hypothetical protein